MEDIAMSDPLKVLSEPEEEANAESDAITGAEIDAETGVTLSENRRFRNSRRGGRH